MSTKIMQLDLNGKITIMDLKLQGAEANGTEIKIEAYVHGKRS